MLLFGQLNLNKLLFIDPHYQCACMTFLDSGFYSITSIFIFMLLFSLQNNTTYIRGGNQRSDRSGDSFKVT